MPQALSSTLPLLIDFGNVALRGDDLQEIIERAVGCICEGVQVGKAAILSLGPDTRLAPRAWAGWDDRMIASLSIDPAGHVPCARVFRSDDEGCSGFSRDRDGDWPDFLSEAGVTALLGAPVRTASMRYAVVEADAEDADHFNADDSAFLGTLANLLAAAFVRLGRHSIGGTWEWRAPRAGASAPPRQVAEFPAAVIERLPIGVALLDAGGTILKSNSFYNYCESLQILSTRQGNDGDVSAGGSLTVDEIALRRPGGDAMWIERESFPMDRFGDDGVEGCSILVDVTKWKLAKPRDANLDLPHRVRNILSVIRVIARRTALRAETVEDYVGQLESRIGALARVQTGLITDPRTGVDLQMMISDEFLSHSIKEDRVRMEGPRIRLWEKAADTFGLAIHELAENAIKYGALANKTGMVAIRWRIDEGANALEFEWSETGARIAVAAPRLRGFGHELIERTLPYELAATTSIEFRPGGIRCTAVIPLSGRVSASPLIRGEF